MVRGVSLTTRRIPSLDGLRAISVGLVLLSHAAISSPFPFSERLELGNLGVRVFFVISGFLITSILLEEMKSKGTIDLKRFYFRRTLRIFPPFYVFVGVTVAAIFIFDIPPDPGGARLDLLYAPLYLANLHGPGTWLLAHAWSLAVEEQFYLAWPTVLLLTGRRAFVWAAALVVTAPAARLLLLAGGSTHLFNTLSPFEAVAAGCLLAGWRDRLHADGRYLSLLRGRFFFIAPAAVLLTEMVFVRDAGLSLVLRQPLMNVLIALVIDAAIVRRTGWLNSRPLVYIGLLSYSVYLWQQPFLSPLLYSVPLSFLWVALASLASYYCVERPALRLRRLWEKDRPRTRRVAHDEGTLVGGEG